MLCGISGVKADRHIRRFVAEALVVPESQVSAAEPEDLVIAASDELGIDRRVADYAIWEAMAGPLSVRAARPARDLSGQIRG
jgi:hypothetical protein